MAPVRFSRYGVVRGLARGLNVLRALNERPAGGWGHKELADYLKIHRTTLKRILETLRELEYVAMDADSGRYCLAPSVRSLASGFREDNALVVAAQEIMPELIEKLVWPVFLSTPEKHAMVSRTRKSSSQPFGVSSHDTGSLLSISRQCHRTRLHSRMRPGAAARTSAQQLFAQNAHKNICQLAGAPDCRASAGRVRR